MRYVVGDIGPDGKTELKFVLKGQNIGDFIDSDVGFVNGRKDFRVGIKMARAEGLKNPTRLRRKMPI